MADATCAGCGCACDDIEATVADGRLSVTRTCALGDAWFAERAAGARRQHRGPRGERRGGGGRRGRDPRPGAGAARLRPRPGEHRGAAPGGGARRGARRDRRSGRRQRGGPRLPGDRLEHGHLRRDPRPRRARRRRGGRTRPSPTRACWAGCAWIARRGSRSSSSTRSARATAEEADAFVALDAAHDFEALWALRALVAGAPLDRDRLGELRSTRSASSPSACGAATTSPSCTARSTSSVRSRCSRSCATSAAIATRSRWRCAATGNARGAEDVLAWQTGFPAAVSFARGHPRANPGELSAAALLERGEVDAALVIALRRARRGCRACASCRPWSSTRATPRRRGRRAWPSPPRPTASRSRAPRTAWTACPSRCARCWTATGRAAEDVLAAIAGRL